jgi:hypothetical protein
MNDGPISTNPNAVGEVGGAVAGFIKKALNVASGKKRRQDEFTQSVESHKSVLTNYQEAHEKFHETAMKTAQAMGYNSSSSMTVETPHGGKVTFGGNRQGTRSRKSPTAKPAAKKPAAAKPAAEKKPAAKVKPVPPAAPVKSRNKGK